MSNSWTERERFLLELTRAYLSTAEIHDFFSLLGYERSKDAVSKFSKKLGLTFKDYGVPAKKDLTDAEETALHGVLSKRTELLSNIQLQEILPVKFNATPREVKSFHQQLLSALNDIRAEIPRLGSVSTKRKAKESNKDSVVVELSDWHFGRETHNEVWEVMYSSDIATKRLLQTPELVAKKLPIPICNVDEVVLALVGDHVDGEGIFPHQAMHIDDHAASQVTRVTRATWQMIQGFKEVFPDTLIRLVTTRGNHGRTESSPEANWDNVFYQQLELLVDMAEDPLLTIKNRYGAYNTFEVKGWKGLMRHKAPVQADTAGAIAKFAGWNAIHNWDFFLFGHYHHWGVMTWQGKPIIRNGSLMGGDDYAEELAYHDDPAQVMFGVSNKEVMTWFRPLRYE